MTKPVLTVTLNPVLDFVAQLSSFSLGKDFHLPEFKVSGGGKGINVSRTLNRLKVETMVTGFLGGAAGHAVEKMLKKEHIHHDFVKILEETRKSMTVLDSGAAKVTRIIERGPVVQRQYHQSFIRKFKTLLRNCSWVVISGRLPFGVPDSFYRDLIRVSRGEGVNVILDTSGNPLKISLSAAPFLIKPNLEEAEAILKRPLKSVAQLENAVKYFLGFGTKMVMISLGDKGAIAGDENGCWLAKAPQVKVKNTVGAGDAMIGGFLYNYAKTQNLSEALKTAVAAGSANCLSLQPGHVAINDVLKLRKKVDLRRLMLK